MKDADSLAKKLAPILEPFEADIQKMHYRVVPSSFDGADPYLRALPLARDWRWPSIEAHVERFSPQAVILQLPHFWQLEPFVQHASRAAGAPVCSVETQNYPLDKAAILLASANTVVAEASEAAAIAEYLQKENIELPLYWILVHASDASSWDISALLKSPRIEVAEEVHLAPGVPLLVQCQKTVSKKSGLFHHSDLFTWNENLLLPAISTKNNLLFTLKDFALPFVLKEFGLCVCGKRLVGRS